jgi:hypothetical protein
MMRRMTFNDTTVIAEMVTTYADRSVNVVDAFDFEEGKLRLISIYMQERETPAHQP